MSMITMRVIHTALYCISILFQSSYSCTIYSDEVHKGILECTKLLKVKVPALKISLSLYLANEDTELIIFRPIKVSE